MQGKIIYNCVKEIESWNWKENKNSKENKDENGILKTNIGPIKPDNSKENKKIKTWIPSLIGLGNDAANARWKIKYCP